MAKSGWVAALEFLKGLPTDVQNTLKIPDKEDPYGHYTYQVNMQTGAWNKPLMYQLKYTGLVADRRWSTTTS